MDAIPEYSYNLSISYNCQFGSLPGSKNITSKGEIERMINKVGCYARNDFYFMNDTGTRRTFVGSAIECAELCHKDHLCQLGWRYQISTKKCRKSVKNWNTIINQKKSTKYNISFFQNK